jgi:hypothetical protein
MKNFILSSAGRILSLAFGVALTGSGVSKLMHDSAGIAVGCLSLLLAVVLSVVALGTAIGEHFAEAALAVVLLPCLAFLGVVGLGLLSPTGGGPLVVAGLGALAFAARRRAAPERAHARLAVARSA